MVHKDYLGQGTQDGHLDFPTAPDLWGYSADDDDVELHVPWMSADIRDKLWPMPKHGSVLLYVHRNRKAH